MPVSSLRVGGGQKGGFKAAFATEIIAEIEALVGTGAVDGRDMEAIEMAARREATRVAARASGKDAPDDHVHSLHARLYAGH